MTDTPKASKSSSRAQSKSLLEQSKRTLVVTDWRNEVYGQRHNGSFVTDEFPISQEKRRGIFSCSGRSCCNRGKKAILNGSRLAIPKHLSLIEYFAMRLRKSAIKPNNEAMNFGHRESETLTFHELDIVSNGMGHVLLSKLGPECVNRNKDSDIIIAVVCPPSVKYVSLLFAIMKIGAGIFPISVDLPQEQIFNSINEVQPVLTIITSEGILVQMLESINLQNIFRFVTIEDIWNSLDDKAANEPILPVPHIKTLPGQPKRIYPPLHNRTVAIISPANATGTCNGVRYNSQAIFKWLLWEWHYFPAISKGEKSLLQGEIDSTSTLVQILSPLLQGNCLVVLEPDQGSNPFVLLQKIEKFKISRITVWPSLLTSILTTIQLIDVDLGKGLLSTVKYWFCTGGVLNHDVAHQFFFLLKEGHRMLINVYGNDENIGVVCYQVLDSIEGVDKLKYHYRLPIGSPVPNFHVYLVNEDMKIVRGEEIGEICIAASENFVTTHGRPNKFILNPFSKLPELKLLLKTGDYGRAVQGAYGRRYLVYETSKGFYRRVFIDNRVVELDEVDANIRGLKDLVKDCHVFCHRTGYEDQIIVAFCCVDDAQALKKIQIALKLKMPDYMIPELIQLDEIPRYEDGEVNENYLLRFHYEESVRRQEFQDWESLDHFSMPQLHAAKVLFEVIFYTLGVPMKEIAAHYQKSFFTIPRASYSKLIFVVHELHRNRYTIDLMEFIVAESLAQMVNYMVKAKDKLGPNTSDPEALSIENTYRVDELKDINKDEAIELLCFTLSSKGSIDYYSDVKIEDLRRFMSSMWILFYKRGLSKVIKRIIDNKIVGIAINVNWHDELIEGENVPLTTQIAYRLQLMQILENGFNATEMSPTNCSVIQICYAVLDEMELNHIEIHKLMEKMIASTVEMATSLRFDAIIFTTFDYFVTDICVNNYGFNVIRECRLNQFIAADSRKPYQHAPDSLIASMCWRKNGKVVSNE